MLTHDVLISLAATYLLACQKVNQQMGHFIPDLCWIDQDTLIVADFNGKQVVKYTLNSVTRTCTGQVLDSGYTASSVSCSQGGLVFATGYTLGVVIVRIYYVNTGDREVWDTNINSQTAEVHVSLSAGFIVLSADNNSYVYSKDRVLLNNVTHDQVAHSFLQTYVTDTGVFLGATWPGYKLLIMNLDTKHTKISTEGILRARGISGSRNGYVYVTAENKTDVGVYLADGTFLHLLYIGPPEGGGGLYYCAAYKHSETEDSIAFGTNNEVKPIAVYRTHR